MKRISEKAVRLPDSAVGCAVIALLSVALSVALCAKPALLNDFAGGDAAFAAVGARRMERRRTAGESLPASEGEDGLTALAEALLQSGSFGRDAGIVARWQNESCLVSAPPPRRDAIFIALPRALPVVLAALLFAAHFARLARRRRAACCATGF